jgi:ABC-type sugar transport system substrate-binding protein
LIDVALKILRGEPVPPAVYIDHVFITPENVTAHYPN